MPRRLSYAERLEALLPADGLRALVVRLEQLRDTHRETAEALHYRTDKDGLVVEWNVMNRYTRRV